MKSYNTDFDLIWETKSVLWTWLFITYVRSESFLRIKYGGLLNLIAVFGGSWRGSHINLVITFSNLLIFEVLVTFLFDKKIFLRVLMKSGVSQGLHIKI